MEELVFYDHFIFIADRRHCRHIFNALFSATHTIRHLYSLHAGQGIYYIS